MALELEDLVLHFNNKAVALNGINNLFNINPPLTYIHPDYWVTIPKYGQVHLDFYGLPVVWQTRPTYDANGKIISPGTKRAGYHLMVRFMKPIKLTAGMKERIPKAVKDRVVAYNVGCVWG